MAELVDALVSNTSELKLVPVRLRSWARKEVTVRASTKDMLQEVIAECKDHKEDKQDHPNILGSHQELFA